MKTKIPAIVAAVISGLCVAFAVWMQYVAVRVWVAVPAAAGSFDSRYFWWPLCAAAVFFALAGFGFSHTGSLSVTMWPNRLYENIGVV